MKSPGESSKSIAYSVELSVDGRSLLHGDFGTSTVGASSGGLLDDELSLVGGESHSEHVGGMLSGLHLEDPTRSSDGEVSHSSGVHGTTFSSEGDEVTTSLDGSHLDDVLHSEVVGTSSGMVGSSTVHEHGFSLMGSQGSDASDGLHSEHVRASLGEEGLSSDDGSSFVGSDSEEVSGSSSGISFLVSVFNGTTSGSKESHSGGSGKFAGSNSNVVSTSFGSEDSFAVSDSHSSTVVDHTDVGASLGKVDSSFVGNEAEMGSSSVSSDSLSVGQKLEMASADTGMASLGNSNGSSSSDLESSGFENGQPLGSLDGSKSGFVGSDSGVVGTDSGGVGGFSSSDSEGSGHSLSVG